jgi:transcriptional regulator with XRE-family HTH domain
MNTGPVTEELMTELGDQLRAQRLRMNLSLEDVARATGLSLNVMSRLENGEGSTLYSFVAVLRALGRSDWLATLQPPVTINPMDMIKRRAPRQRAYKPRQKKGLAGPT